LHLKAGSKGGFPMGDRIASARTVAYRRIARSALLAAFLILLAVTLPAPIRTALQAAAGPIIVNTTLDETTSGDGLCSLREAINNANAKADTTSGDCIAGTGTDAINFSVSGTITLGSGLPAIQNTLTIDGTGQAITVDGGNNSFDLVTVNSGGTLNLSDLTAARGSPAAFNSGTLTVANAVFTGGGANGNDVIINQNTMTVAGSSFSSNGEAIGSGGDLTVTKSKFLNNNRAIDSTNSTSNVTVSDSFFSGNGSDVIGGAIFCAGGTAAISNSTFSGNFASLNGGAVGTGLAAGSKCTLTVTNSTFSANKATGLFANGGAIFNGAASTLTVTNSTFTGNSTIAGAGAGIFNQAVSPATATVSNSILAGNLISVSNVGANCSGSTIVNGGGNISDDATCGFGTTTGANGQTIGDNVNPLLDPNGLQNNGGPTQTIALQSGSPAIDAVPIASCPSTDQRGLARPDPGDSGTAACDIGALESGAIATPTNPDANSYADAYLHAHINLHADTDTNADKD
jgi:CSLREA domain-containing protein